MPVLQNMYTFSHPSRTTCIYLKLSPNNFFDDGFKE